MPSSAVMTFGGPHEFEQSVRATELKVIVTPSPLASTRSRLKARQSYSTGRATSRQPKKMYVTIRSKSAIISRSPERPVEHLCT